jgi:hypothetical protein
VGFGILLGGWLGPVLHLSRIEGDGRRRSAGRRACNFAGSSPVCTAWDSRPACIRLVRSRLEPDLRLDGSRDSR